MASRKAPDGVREGRPRTPGPIARPAAQPAAAARPELRSALLDVNVLIALLDEDHLHHRRASDWLLANFKAGWASCAITQNGCIRIMSQPSYPNSLPAARVARHLREATQTAHHRFVADDLSLLDVQRFDADLLLGHRQVTDAYLLGLAVSHDMRFVTFDGNVPVRVVRGASAAHVVML